jgi:hypothetical protein
MSNSQWKLVLALAAVVHFRPLMSRVDVGCASWIVMDGIL